MQGIEDKAFNLLVDVFCIFVDTVVRGQTNSLVARGGNGDGRYRGVGILGINLGSYRFANLFGRYTLLFELDDVVATTGKVDTLRKSAVERKPIETTAPIKKMVTEALALPMKLTFVLARKLRLMPVTK